MKEDGKKGKEGLWFVVTPGFQPPPPSSLQPSQPRNLNFCAAERARLFGKGNFPNRQTEKTGALNCLCIEQTVQLQA